MATEMKRSRAQVLRGFLPQKTFEHPNETIAKVLSTPAGTAAVDPGLLLAAVDHQLERWVITDPQTGQNITRAPGFQLPVHANADSYAAVEPEGPMFYKTWPLVLRCTNKKGNCERVEFFDDEAAWKTAQKFGNPARCNLCGSPRRQMDYILVHECGRDSQLQVPSCQVVDGAGKAHGYRHVYLNDTGSFETATWRCRFGSCAASGPMGRRISNMRQPGCGCGLSPTYRHVTLRQDIAYISHTLKLVNFEPAPMIELSESPGSEKVVIGSYLEYFSTDWQKALTDVGKDREGAEKRFRNIKRLMELDGETPEAIEEVRLDMLGKAGGAFDDIVSAVGDDVVQTVGANQRARERTLIWGQAAGLSVWRMDRFERAARESGRSGALQVIEQSRGKLAEYGFSDLLVVDNFPVALAAYGYTRIYRKAELAFLRPFPVLNRGGAKVKNKTPIYCSTTTTEAVFFELDAERVIAWLAANGHLVSLPPALPSADDEGGLTRRRAAKAFMLREMSAHAAVREMCFQLQHTIAHALIKNLGERSGFGEDTMSEYLIPDLLTVGLFADVHQELSLGALVALVEHRLGEWLDAAGEGARDCQWDPHCGAHDGACSACLHLAFGCDDFNDRLDRATLYGSPDGHEPVIKNGYWDWVPALP
jgi:hypothetical protein